MRFLRRTTAAVFLIAVLCGCQSLPYADDRAIPSPVVVADGSAERAALNAAVYDAAIALVTRRFYRRDFGGVDWPSRAAGLREAAVGEPGETGFYRALNTTLALLDDPHTNAVAPSVNQRRQQARLAEGPQFGMTLVRSGERFIVTRLRPDGPAAEAGVRPGWRVETVDGAAFDASRTYIDGPGMWRFTDADDVVHDLTLVARPMPRAMPRIFRRPDGVLFIQFDEFDRASREAVLDRLETELADPPAAIVIDLRDNGGGLDSEVGRLLSPFFEAGLEYGVAEFGWLPDRRLRTRAATVRFRGPMAVLTSRQSASGAELFAAFVQEQGRGPIVGGATAGAVVGSRHFALPDGGRLSVGVVAFRTGAGTVLERVGVTPDVLVEPSERDLRSGEDPVLERAVEALKRPQAGITRTLEAASRARSRASSVVAPRAVATPMRRRS
ncbi:S41 family peptidase [Brevundimonas sp.]|uniref:S41 family peptidase n=1 Tax=Brevundimonas sp. TaxID=1871086 RepID=UPI002CF24F78|nr:S41 family peptidase [Brevundimonas sp.]HWQ86277.1 S41 family peptidase [Brevundimonas sp.]